MRKKSFSIFMVVSESAETFEGVSYCVVRFFTLYVLSVELIL